LKRVRLLSERTETPKGGVLQRKTSYGCAEPLVKNGPSMDKVNDLDTRLRGIEMYEVMATGR
jgi:hypothetical protein